MQAGKHYKLIVERQTDIGYILLEEEDSSEEIFIHNNDTYGQELTEGELVDVFLYVDHKGRVAATLGESKITLDKYDWVEVVGGIRTGVFVDIGIRKDLLVSEDDLPIDKDIWPKNGDKLYCRVIDHKGKLLAKPGSRNVLEELQKPAPSDLSGKLTVTIFNIGEHGANVISEEGYIGFIHNSEYKEEPRLGQLVEGRLTNVKENGEINLSLIPQKELAMDDDAELIISKLEKIGMLPLSDKSDPEDIKAHLGISKAAFKRAVGRLLKEGKITQDKQAEKIHLTE
ncbi:CvfB family protein [Haloplasma contractile]|uniref:S1 RNA binding domain protein n=1 Tax=Haloplasma contractile SSD-17B TaxID=1033810 RepID=U2EEC6_9MOLU|nr:S1-like domain-containing RNA-binding protein [Haloplasma contractile]ERJ13046.1 S1 RNA binding domain protein [Haloplasma contractile SSD-17B]